jgi:beta-glucanase (GH16 family)
MNYPVSRKSVICVLAFGWLAPVLAEEAGWELVWSDEFEYEGSPDPAKWTHEIGRGVGGWGNSEVQYYTDELANSRVEGGRLIIEVHQQLEGTRTPTYTSARLITKGKGEWKYGRMEARIKVPSVVGTWSAFWMLAAEQVYGDALWPDNGEIDIMEHVGYQDDPTFRQLTNDPEPENIHGTVHTSKRNFNDGTRGIGGGIHVPDPAADFHVFAITWTEDSIAFEMDGQVYFNLGIDGVGIPLRNPPEDTWEYWPFKEEFFIILNVAIGGDWGGVFNTRLFPASPYGPDGIDHDADWPQRMEVDYVRVYQRAETATWKGLAVDASGDAETGGWMGRINVNTAPWIWSYRLGSFILPEAANAEVFHTDSQWIYIPRM